MEWIFLAVGVVVVAAGLARRHFGTGETLALLGLLLSVRSLARVALARLKFGQPLLAYEPVPTSTRQPRRR